jgi:hypothetical protein
MTRTVSLAAGAVVTAVLSAFAARGTSPARPGAPVLVELFTSEGCSSCPSADALLRALHDTQPIDGADVVILSEHVDYWNRLGWIDPFSSAAFTARQREYVTRLRAESLYTPQAVVDGRAEVIGNDRPALTAAIRAAAGRPKGVLQVTAVGHGTASIRVSVRGTGLTAGADLVLALAEDDLAVQVARGENARKRLQHSGVVRRWMRVGRVGGDGAAEVTDAVVDLDPAWNRRALRFVAIAQASGPGAVTGLGVARLAE